MTRTHDEPSEVNAEEGAVIVDGPDGVAVTLTPNAAADTAARLSEEAVHAREQQATTRKEDEEGVGDRS